MWYFAWILGLPLAAAVAVLNAMWYEMMDDEVKKRQLLQETHPSQPRTANSDRPML